MLVSVAPAVDDLALEIKHGDDVGVAASRRRAAECWPRGDVVADGHLLEGQRNLGKAAGRRDLAEVVEDVAEVGELVDQVRVARVLGQDVAVGIDELLQRGWRRRRGCRRPRPRKSPQRSPSSFCVSSRSASLILSRMKGSTADLYLPTRVTWTSMPYLSKSVACSRSSRWRGRAFPSRRRD